MEECIEQARKRQWRDGKLEMAAAETWDGEKIEAVRRRRRLVLDERDGHRRIATRKDRGRYTGTTGTGAVEYARSSVDAV